MVKSRASAAALLLLIASVALATSCGKDASDGTAVSGRRAFAGPSRVGDAVCAECHADLHRTYHDTVAKARSFDRIQDAPEVEDWEQDNVLLHEATGFYYRMEKRDGRYYQRRWLEAADGTRTHEFEREATHVMGSGRHVRTYVHYQEGGEARQLPVSWHAATSSWQMSPGYEHAQHWGFRRAIDHDCMFCHNAYPSVPEGAASNSVYAGALPSGIGCERCHGDGGLHAAVARDPASTRDEVVEAIVNPGSLTPKRAMDVCMQCHREPTIDSGLPRSVRRFSRDVFSYQPGQDLEDYTLSIGPPPGSDVEERFAIANYGYRLMQSACFEKSDGQLSCTTCHDPHHTPAAGDRVTLMRQACLSCHGQEDCGVEDGDVAASGVDVGDCAKCHMHKRRTIDVVHAVKTDHEIVRRPPEGDLLAPRSESREAYDGELAFFLPETAPEGPEADLYLGTAYLQAHHHVELGVEMIQRALEEGAPAHPIPLRVLGLAHRARGEFDEAAAALTRALQEDPDDVEIMSLLGSVELQRGRGNDARRRLAAALALDPDHAFSLVMLADVEAQAGNLAQAKQHLERVIATRPEHLKARRGLAQLAMVMQDPVGARNHLRMFLSITPRDVTALVDLGYIERTVRLWPSAKVLADQAVALAPADLEVARFAVTVYTTASDAAQRDGARALELLQVLLAAPAPQPLEVPVLAAAAHAEVGDFAKALEYIDVAIERAGTEADEAVVAHFKERRARYEAGACWHEPR